MSNDIDIEKTQVAPEEEAKKTDAPDLEKMRDEKCIPVAQAILGDMATDLLSEPVDGKTDYSQIILKILKKNFDVDMNITTESPYVFQLILGVLTGLNQTLQICDLEPVDEIRYNEIGKKILTILAGSNVKMGSVTPEETTQNFVTVKTQLNELFAQEKLSRLELKYVVDNIFNSFKAVNDLYSQNVEQSVAKAEAKLFGVDAMSDLTLKRLDEVLKATVEEQVKE